MARHWVTCGTPTMPGMLNPFAAACDRDYVPDEVHVLANPGVAAYVDEASEHFQTIVSAYDGDAAVHQHTLVEETDFEGIVDYYRSAIDEATRAGDTVAVDITPGRKFMSAIAFQSGIHFEADHVFYFYRKADDYPGQFYPEIPRTATELIDFTEVV